MLFTISDWNKSETWLHIQKKDINLQTQIIMHKILTYIDKLKQNIIIIIIDSFIVIDAIILLFSAIYPSSLNWGGHLLAFYPYEMRFLIPALLLLLLVPEIREFIVNYMENVSSNLHSRSRLTKFSISSIALIICGLLLWSLKTELHFLGDGYLLLRTVPFILNNSTSIGPIFLNEPFIGFLIVQLSKFFWALEITNNVETVYRLLSIFSGLIFIVVVFNYTLLISNKLVERLIALVFIISSGASQLFFGYVENYSLLLPSSMLFVILGILFIQGRVNIFLPLISYSFLIVINVGTIIWLPAFFLIIFEGYKRRKWFETSIATLCALITMILLYWISDVQIKEMFNQFTKKNHLLLPLNFSSQYHNYNFLSIAHAVDLLNLCFLIQPAVIIILIINLNFWFNNIKKSIEKIFLLMMMAGSALFLSVVNCELGTSRDWDVLAPFYVIFSVSAVYGWFKGNQLHHQKLNLISALAMVSIIQTGLWIGVNANETRGLQRLDIINESSIWSQIAKHRLYEERAIFHRNKKDFEKEILFYEKALKQQPTHDRTLLNLAMCYMDNGEIFKSLDLFKRLDSLGKATAITYLNMGVLLIKAQQYDTALVYLLKAETLDSTQACIPLNIGIAYAQSHKSCDYGLPYFLKAIKRDSLYAEAYYNVAFCYSQQGEKALSEKYYSKYLKLKTDHR